MDTATLDTSARTLYAWVHLTDADGIDRGQDKLHGATRAEMVAKALGAAAEHDLAPDAEGVALLTDQLAVACNALDVPLYADQGTGKEAGAMSVYPCSASGVNLDRGVRA